MGSFNELCSPHSLEEGHSVPQAGSVSAHRPDVCSDVESTASCAVSHAEDAEENCIETAFLAQAELHLRTACTERLLAIWHEETRLRLTGSCLKLHTDRTVQVSHSDRCNSQDDVLFQPASEHVSICMIAENIRGHTGSASLPSIGTYHALDPLSHFRLTGDKDGSSAHLITTICSLYRQVHYSCGI